MNILLEDVARTKVCPRLATECHGSGCMAWQAEPRASQTKESIDWPEDIVRPKIDFDNPLNSGLGHRELALKLHEQATEALRPLVGAMRGDKTITRAMPADIQLKQVTLTLQGPAYGQCLEMGARA